MRLLEPAGSSQKHLWERLFDRTYDKPFIVDSGVRPRPNAFRCSAWEAARWRSSDARFRVICADAVTYVARLNRSKDVILGDACDRAGVAPEFNAVEFYQDARRCLSPGGVFVINMCSDIDRCLAHLAKIRAVFGSDVMTLQVRPNGNVIVLAFKELPRPEIGWERLGLTAANLKRQFDLDFPRYVRRFAHLSSRAVKSTGKPLEQLKPQEAAETGSEAHGQVLGMKR